jgi:outer membrane receptor protein involved in Fe transport
MPQSRLIEVERRRRSAKLMGVLMSAASLTAIAATGAHAQTTATAPTATSPAPAQLQEVVVTANRSGAQSVQNVSIPISVVDPKLVDQSGLGNLSDLTKFAPSLSIVEGAPGFNQITMLGLTAMPYRTSDTSDRSLVAVYLDDTPISVQGQTPDLRVYDLERVEILRGPQGTLYGDSSMAGTIRYITAKPSSTSSFGTLEVTGADTDHGSPSYSVRGMFNTPIIEDKLGFRGTFYDGQDGGYINNIGDRDKKDANLNNSIQGRGALRWTPDKTLTIDLSATFEQSHSHGLNTVESGLAPYTDSTNGAEGTRDSFQLYQLNIDKDLGFANLVSSTAYTWRRIGYSSSTESTIGYYFDNAYYPQLKGLYKTYPVFSAAGFPGGAYSQAVADAIPAEHYNIDNKIHDVMQELRLVSKDNGPIKWTVGGFYEYQRRNLVQDIPVAGFDTLAYTSQYYQLATGKPYNSQTVAGAFHPNDIFSGLQNETDSQFALFTDDTWHVTKKLDLTAGVRYFDYSENYYLYEGGIFGAINNVPLTTNAKEKANGFNPRFNASYHVDDDLMIYAEAAKGFRYGGANQPTPTATPANSKGSVPQKCLYDLEQYGYTAAPLTFGPDNLWDYTVGEKAKLAGGRMTFNADAYYIDWSDVQTRLLLNCSYFFTESAGSIHSKGVEAETTFKVTRALTVSGSVGYNDSHAAGNIPTVGAFAGDQAPYSPNWIASAFVYYDKPVADGMMHLQASYQFRSEQDTTFDPYSTSYSATTGVLSKTGPNGGFAIIPPSNDVNASAAYDFGRYEIGIYGTNITNGLKVTNIVRPSYYQPFVAGNYETVARPLTVGLRLKAKF